MSDHMSFIKSKTSVQLPWSTKYRPQAVDDIVGQESAKLIFQKALEQQDLPHVLCSGPPGCGKTSMALAFLRDLKKHCSVNFIELNASDERGVNVVRGRIKDMAQRLPATKDGVESCNYIILDECDYMTSAAQAALLRTIEVNAKSTRFILLCNHISKISSPLASRCVKLKFKKISKNDLKQRILNVANAENVGIEPNALDILVEHCQGDLRSAIQSLENLSSLANGTISESLLDEVLHTSDIQKFRSYYALLSSGTLPEIQAVLKSLLDEVVNEYQFMLELQKCFIQDPRVTDFRKQELTLRIYRLERQLKQHGSPFLNLQSLSLGIRYSIRNSLRETA